MPLNNKSIQLVDRVCFESTEEPDIAKNSKHAKHEQENNMLKHALISEHVRVLQGRSPSTAQGDVCGSTARRMSHPCNQHS